MSNRTSGIDSLILDDPIVNNVRSDDHNVAGMRHQIFDNAFVAYGIRHPEEARIIIHNGAAPGCCMASLVKVDTAPTLLVKSGGSAANIVDALDSLLRETFGALSRFETIKPPRSKFSIGGLRANAALGIEQRQKAFKVDRSVWWAELPDNTGDSP